MTDSDLRSFTIPRRDLYHRVWSIPIRKLAVELGISDRGLTKICRRHRIPVPSSGHWAQRAAGKKTVVPRLPALTDRALDPVKIICRQPRPKLEIPAWLEGQVTKIRADATLENVGELRHLHPIVESHIDRARSRDHVDDRMHRILNALLKALEKHGGEVNEASRASSLLLKAYNTEIFFSIRRKTTAIRRPITHLQKRLQRLDNNWIEDAVATAQLVFQIKTYHPGWGRTEWRDTRKAPLETLIPTLVERLFVAAAIRSDWQKKLHEENVRREETAIVLRAEEKFWRRFLGLAMEWEEAVRVRRFLDALDARGFDGAVVVDGMTVAEWMRWARQRVERYDPLGLGVAAVFARLRRQPGSP